MKTFDKKDVFSWVNCEEAKQYIGQKGYMADSNIGLQETINIHRVYELKDIDENNVLCFYRPQCDYGRGLFLPADKVKEVEKEKKWRPFTLEEFLNKFSIGTKISFRRRDMTRSTYGLFEGYQTDIDETETYHKIIICNLWYTLNDLFETYEYLDEHGNWQPFGVLEND